MPTDQKRRLAAILFADIVGYTSPDATQRTAKAVLAQVKKRG